MTSPNDSVIYPGGSTITDAAGNNWDVNPQGLVDMNGAPDPNTANVIEMAYVNGQVWQENASFLWWAWNPNSADNYNGWSPSAGTTVDPLTQGNVGLGSNMMLWQGGGSNNANDPSQWDQQRIPQPGDALVMNGGTMNVQGNDLAGDPLNLVQAFGSSAPYHVTLNLSGADAKIHPVSGGSDSFELQTNGPSPVSVDLTGGDSVGLSSQIKIPLTTHLTVTGNPTFAYGLHVDGVPHSSSFDNEGTITLTNAMINSPVAGSGTFNLERYHDGPGNVFINGTSGGNLTYNMGGDQGFASDLHINEYPYFQSQINVLANGLSGGPGADEIDFQDLHATSYDIKPDLLTLYNGNNVLDTVKLNSALPFTVADTNGGTNVYFGEPPPSNATILPLH